MIGLIHKMAKGLAKSRAQLTDALEVAMGRGLFDDAAADAIEEALILADVGPESTDELVTQLREFVRKAGGGVTKETVRQALAAQIARLLAAPDPRGAETEPPQVILMIGVNGTGKTTTTAKLAQQEVEQGRKVVLGAGDTFRAAAIDQLKVWGDRIGAEVIAQAAGADPAAVAFDAVQAGIARKADTVIIDTAGRLHTKVNLMTELEKVVRVVRKLREPREVLLVLDATTGQNGILQVESFGKVLPLTGLVITKLDGTARAGVVLQAVKKFNIPVRYIGVGETAADLLPFDPDKFAEALLS